MFENVTEIEDLHHITPDFIYNRIDMHGCNYFTLKIDQIDNLAVEYKIEGTTAVLGVWLMELSSSQLSEICDFIFEKHKNVNQISYEYAKSPIGYYHQKNHFRIELPGNIEELNGRLSKKGRYNIKREKRIIDEEFGGYRVEEYTADNVPDTIIYKYFDMKKKTHGIDYHLTPVQYLSKYHVTNIYVLIMGEIISAIILSCEQCNVVYIENITYDLDYAKYSTGQIIYDIYLEKLIEKKRNSLFLAGGDLDYKKRYGSIEEEAYVGIVYRYRINEWLRKTKDLMKSIIKGK